MFKTLWRLSREAVQYKALYIWAILSTLTLTGINLAAPKLLSSMTGLVEKGVDEAGLHTIGLLTAVLVGLYLLRILFRFLSNYLAHKAAWYLVGDLRTRTYDKLEHMHLGYFHDKQTGDLMSRIVNDTRDFELLYAHMIPESITNLVTFTGVLIVLLTINWKLALITCAPIPLIFASGIIFSRKVRPFFRISQKKMGELNGKLQDNLSGIHEIQSFGREEYETERVNEQNFEHIHAMLKALKISAVFHPSVEFISSLGTILVVGGFRRIPGLQGRAERGRHRRLPAVSGTVLQARHRSGQPAGTCSSQWPALSAYWMCWMHRPRSGTAGMLKPFRIFRERLPSIM